MSVTVGHILIVDDHEINRKVLARLMSSHGHTFDTAENGEAALEKLRRKDQKPFDVVLLDVMMPVMDGYETLTQLKQDDTLRHLPVIMVTAVDEMDSVIRCITMGATDYLPKPFNAALLQARINASLAGKRLRDLELEYLEQVGYVTEAATRIEAGTFAEESLAKVADRSDALGRLAKVFQRMAREVHAREQRLKQQLEQLRCDIEDHQRATGDSPDAYLPMDRRQALVAGVGLPDRMRGAALFADISGFTALTERLAQELGFQRGAEEITRQLNRVYDALVGRVHQFGGSVIAFGGDAITCWFDGDAGPRAAACAFAMQAEMAVFAEILTPAGSTLSLGLKVAVAAGPARRFLVGDPGEQHLEVMAGELFDALSAAEHQAGRGEVVLTAAAVAAVPGLEVREWRGENAGRVAVVARLAAPAPAAPWPGIAPVSDAAARPWLLPLVYEKVHRGESEFLSELRPSAALLVQFAGIDYDADDDAGAKLDAFVRFVQGVVGAFDGALTLVSMGDKGSSLCVVFGAPSAHSDDAARAVKAAMALRTPPRELGFIRDLRMGVAYGPMRAGAYGCPAQRAYGVIGDPINLAARLMVADGHDTVCDILCDESIRQLAQGAVAFEALPPVQVKGKTAPVAVFRPVALRGGVAQIDLLPAAAQLTLKVASVLGDSFPIELLRGIHPVPAECESLEEQLRLLAGQRLLGISDDALAGEFPDSAVREAAYNLLLFAQRRQLHRQAAEWLEAHPVAGSGAHASIARHWRGAEDWPRAIAQLEMAGDEARREGLLTQAQAYIKESLALEGAAKGGG